MRIKPLLRRLYPAPTRPDPAVRDALEADLMRSMSTRAADRPRRRWLLGGALGAAALVGACAVPTDYELSVGHRIMLTMDASQVDFDPEALAKHLEDNFALDELRVMVAVSKRGPDPDAAAELRVAMDVVGRADITEIEASMVETFPVLSEVDIDIEALDGTVHGTLGGMLTERALGLHLDRRSVDETRARILAELAARGLDGSATVEIEDEETPFGRRREVRVRVEAEGTQIDNIEELEQELEHEIGGSAGQR